MVKIVVGEKGKGKTKVLLESANNIVGTSKGSTVYLDKNSKKIYELNKDIRLINLLEYCTCGEELLKGFICGLVAGNNDIESVYIDSFLTLANIDENTGLDLVLNDLKKISDNYDIEIVISLSANVSRVPESYKENIISAL